RAARLKRRLLRVYQRRDLTVDDPGPRASICQRATRPRLRRPQGRAGRTHRGARPRARGRGRLVLLVGEPGIGKTHLANELAEHAASHGVQVLWGRGWKGEGAPAYGPWLQIIRAAIKPRASRGLESAIRSGVFCAYVPHRSPDWNC